jgi:hypothetical protein
MRIALSLEIIKFEGNWIGGKAERNEIQLAKSELDLKATHIDPATSPYIDLHIIVNSESIAIRSEREKIPRPFSLQSSMISQNSVERNVKRRGKEVRCHVLASYAIVNVKVNLFINMNTFERSAEPLALKKKRKSLWLCKCCFNKCRKYKHNVITVIVASSRKLSCNLMSIVPLLLLLME